MKQKRKQFFLIILVLLSALIVLAGLMTLHHYNKTPHLSFSDWVEIKPIQEDEHKFYFAIASMLSAEETWTTYRELVDYVGDQYGHEASMVLKPSYSDVRILLRDEKVDLALVCTGTYIMCTRAKTVDLIAIPEFKNDHEYRCFFVVNKKSTIKGIEDLKGKSFAFTDPESNTGCIVPSWLIWKEGIAPNEYFGKIIHTGSHDRSLEAVAKGLVDGASVDSLVYYSLVEKHPELKESLHIIWESEPFGPPPVVAPSGLSESEKQRLREIFLSMHKDDEAREILSGIGIERFRLPQPGEYNSAYEIWDTVRNPKRK